MKKLFATLLPALFLMVSCQPIDPVREMEEYTDVVVYSHDVYTQSGYASDCASLKVKGDYSTGYFLLELNDFKLAENMPLKSSTVGNLIQYLDENKNSSNEIIGYNYTYFKTEGIASYTGDLQVIDLKFGWLSSIFWGSFISDAAQYKVWFVPRKVQMYANRNTIINLRGDSIAEKAIRPRFDLEFDVDKQTASISASAVTLPVSTSTGEQFDIRSMTWPSLPLVYNEKGFTIDVASFHPTTDGVSDKYIITDFRCNFEVSYDGTRTIDYTLTRVADNVAIHVTSQFDYFRQNI
ncbi:MAG: hypothetical protein HDR45_06495 [Bacteroides sp.]|nr:hypothetical protein [Bacteroides sp.]